MNIHLTSALNSALNLCRALVLDASAESHAPRLLPALELLPPLIPHFIGVLTEDEQTQVVEDSFGMLTNDAHRVWQDDDDALGKDALPQLMGLISSMFGAYHSLRNEAEVALSHHGQYRTAVVLAAAASEMLLNTLMASVLLESESDLCAARTMLEPRDSMKTKAARVLAGHIGGQWDGRQGTPVGSWIQKLVFPRNAILHAGAAVTRAEAQEALGALHEFRRWLGGRVFSSRRKFPYTTLIVSLGLMMSPTGTESNQGKWLLDRLAEADGNFGEFIERLASWARDIWQQDL